MLRKAKRNHYENLDLNDINDNKKFCTMVKPLFCNKIKSVENITLDQNSKVVREEKEAANILNDFFVSTVPNSGINTEHDFLNTTKVSHNPIENAVYKYENHPSVITIKKYMKGTYSLISFQTFTKENIVKLITNLDIKKAVQFMDIPTKLVKEFGCLFSSFIASNINKCINKILTWMLLKKPKFDQFRKKMEEQNIQTIGALVSFPMFMKHACMTKFILILIKYFQGISADFVKVLAHSISFQL